MENHLFYSENSLFLWPFSIAMLNYHRVHSGKRKRNIYRKTHTKRLEHGKTHGKTIGEWRLHSGKLTICYWKWPQKMDPPMKHGDFLYIYIYIVNVYQRAKGSHWDFSWGSYWNWLGCLGIDEDLQYTEVSQHRNSITDRFRFLCHVREANTKGQVSWVTNHHKSAMSSINAINHDEK